MRRCYGILAQKDTGTFDRFDFGRGAICSKIALIEKKRAVRQAGRGRTDIRLLAQSTKK